MNAIGGGYSGSTCTPCDWVDSFNYKCETDGCVPGSQNNYCVCLYGAGIITTIGMGSPAGIGATITAGLASMM